MRYEDVTGQELSSMTNAELKKYIMSAKRIVKERLLGKRNTRGTIDFLTEQLERDYNYPIPKSFADYYDYQKIRSGEISPQEGIENLRKKIMEIPKRYDISEEIALLKGDNKSKLLAHSKLVNKARRVREFLKTETTIERIKGQFSAFRKKVKMANERFKEMGLEIEVPTMYGKEARDVFQVMRRVMEAERSLEDESNALKRYETYRNIILTIRNKDFKHYTYEELANIIIENMEKSEVEKEQVKREKKRNVLSIRSRKGS